MPVAACLHPHSCLARRDEVFRKDAIWTRDHECTSCIIGTARRMCSFTPEPDIAPQPLRDSGKPRLPVTLGPCSVCGETVTAPGAKMHRACLDSTRTKTKGPKPERDRTRCRNGHSLERYGMPRNDGGVRCRICTRNRKHEAYQRAKEATP
jgi:hypothetical protein